MARLSGRDIRKTTGSNLKLIHDETGLDAWQASPGQLRAALQASGRVEILSLDEWRIPYLRKLLDNRRNSYYKGNEDEDYQSLIDSLCVN